MGAMISLPILIVKQRHGVSDVTGDSEGFRERGIAATFGDVLPDSV